MKLYHICFNLFFFVSFFFLPFVFVLFFLVIFFVCELTFAVVKEISKKKKKN